MKERQPERRSLPGPGDRRSNREQPARLDWADLKPAVPGTIRPGPGEVAPLVERRRVPESGME